LGLKNAGAYNVDTCCSSFITMLEIACGLIQAGIKKQVLIVASSIDSHINDKSTYWSVNTGDAAAAGIVSQVEDGFGYLASHSTSHGDRHAAIVLHRRPPELLVTTSHGPQYMQEFVTFYDHTLCKEVAIHAQEDMVEVVTRALEHAQMSIADVDFLVTHQPVAWAADAWKAGLGMPQEKFYESFAQYGNVACASVPVNLMEALEKHLIAAGDRVLIASSGVGENHLALVEKISPQLIRKTRL
jgi:3-oxoacyl-[acyl-carrier-protein] synthase-3